MVYYKFLWAKAFTYSRQARQASNIETAINNEPPI